MDEYLISKVSEILNGELYITKPYYINQVFTDSRSAYATENGLFFAIRGERHDGHHYIDEIYKKGIRNFIVESYLERYSEFPNANFIVVNNSIEALQQFAIHHRNLYNIPIIGITGSNGKTIIKDWLAQIINYDKIITKSPKSYNSQIGVPLSILQLSKNSQVGIFEAGISMLTEMERIQKIIQPKIGIFTNIGNAHQENFKSINEKVKEKLKLFKDCSTLIYCKDHKEIQQKIYQDEELSGIKLFSWSKKQNADLQISTIEKSNIFTKIKGIFKEEEVGIEIPFTDNASIENAIHVWSTLLVLNYSESFIKPKMRTLIPIAMRLELKEGVNNCTIINDSYNSDYESLNIAVDYLLQQNQHKKKTIILSDILQSGLNPEELYQKVDSLLKQKKIGRLIGVGEDIFKEQKQFSIKSTFYRSTQDLIKELSKLNFNDEAILLKGARKFAFERISESLQKKAHRTVLEINLDAITHNLNVFKKQLDSNTKVMVMVKAFSYGSGTFEIANLLEHNRVDYLGVAYIDEGIALRKAGINLPIMVMNPEEQGISTMINYKLEPELYSFKSLKAFIQTTQRKNIKNYPVHFKIDTGMHRLGFQLNEIAELIQIIKDHQLKISSVFSHLAAADQDIHNDFTLQQFEAFEKAQTIFNAEFDYKILYHILNSAGIERFKQNQYDMVRLGIGLYGIGNNLELKNISTLKTQISQIKSIALNETIGYSRMGKLEKPGKIATIPIGYADGLNRLLSNGNGNVFVNGKLAPIVGNICMDMTMIDITDVDANEGDTVIVFGNEIPVSELAEKLNTIPYEVFTSISERVKRVYYHENL